MTDLQPYAMTKPEEEDEWFGKPFSLVDAKGTVWDTASNRQWLVAVKAPRGKSPYSRWSGNAENLSIMLKLIQAEPVSPRSVKVAKLTEWAQGDGLGRLLDVVVSLDKVAKLLQLAKGGQVQLWSATPVALGPCIGLTQPTLRVFLMGHDEPKIEKGTSIAPFGKPPEQDGFELAMSLD